VNTKSLILQLHDERFVTIPEDQLDYNEKTEEGDGFTDRVVTVQTKDGKLGISSYRRAFKKSEDTIGHPIRAGSYLVTPFGSIGPSSVGTDGSFGFPSSFLVDANGGLTKYEKDRIYVKGDEWDDPFIWISSWEKYVRLGDYGAITYRKTNDTRGFERFCYRVKRLVDLS